MGVTIRFGNRRVTRREVDQLCSAALGHKGSRAQRKHWTRRFEQLARIARDALEENGAERAVSVLCEMIAETQARALVARKPLDISIIYPLNTIADCERAFLTFDHFFDAMGEEPGVIESIETAFYGFLRRCQLIGMAMVDLSTFVWQHAWRFVPSFSTNLIDVSPVATVLPPTTEQRAARRLPNIRMTMRLDYRRLLEWIRLEICSKAHLADQPDSFAPILPADPECETAARIGVRVRKMFEATGPISIGRTVQSDDRVEALAHGMRWDTRQEPIRSDHVSIDDVVADPLRVISPPPTSHSNERCYVMPERPAIVAPTSTDGLRVSDLEFLTPDEQRRELERARLAMAEADAISLRTGALNALDLRGDVQLDELGDLTNSDTWTTPSSLVQDIANRIATDGLRGEWFAEEGMGAPMFVNPPYAEARAPSAAMTIAPIVPLEFDQLPPQPEIEMRTWTGQYKPLPIADAIQSASEDPHKRIIDEERTSKVEIEYLDEEY